MNKTKRLKLLTVIANSLLIVFVVIAGLVILGFANGYRFDWVNFKVQKMGALVINSTPTNVSVLVNEKPYSLGTLSNVLTLLPGRYSVQVTRDGYQNWTTFARIESGQAVFHDRVLLFLTNPILTLERAATPREQSVVDIHPRIIIDGGELRVRSENSASENGVFVTRFSGSILSAEVLSSNHIVFQIGREVRVIEMSGTNNTFLLELESASPVKFIPRSNGTLLGIVDTEGVLREYRIR